MRHGHHARVRNPDWTIAAAIGATGFLVGAGVAALALRKRGPQDVYYYWAEQTEKPSLEFANIEYVPKIQNARTGEIFELDGEITEQGALWAAQAEIDKRGGIAQQGQPIAQNPHHRRGHRLSLRRQGVRHA